MPRTTKLYTRTGDDGTTGLGGGQRVGKDALRVEAYGTVDELNSQIGVTVAVGLDPELEEALVRLQKILFRLGADLSTLETDKGRRKVPSIEQAQVEWLEELVDRLSSKLPTLKNFILPGGSPGAAQLHLARTVCRRAERVVVDLARKEEVGPTTVPFLNRLSDGLFVMARYENRQQSVADVLWDRQS